MHDDPSKHLSDSERDAMQAMRHSGAPSPDLEDRTVMALKERGLVRPRGGGILMKLSVAVGSLVALAAIFVAGVSVGTKQSEPVPVANVETAPQFMLLLFTEPRPEPVNAQPMNEEQFAAMIAEYRGWGEELATQGLFIGAEKLKDTCTLMSGREAETVSNKLPEGRVLGGYYLIRANDLEHAQQLATSHPHLKYGGTIEIRPIDPLDGS